MNREEANKILNLLNVEELKQIQGRLQRLNEILKNRPESEITLMTIYDLMKYIENQTIIESLLLSEIRYDDLKRRRALSVQKTFEKYITTVLEPSYSNANIYGDVNKLFSFTNHASFYLLNEPLFISEYILNRQRKVYKWDTNSRQARDNELEKYLLIVKERLGNNIHLVKFKAEDVEKDIITLESGDIKHSFNLLQMDYLDKFLGKDSDMYISEETPIVYSESDKVKAYVLGLMPRVNNHQK